MRAPEEIIGKYRIKDANHFNTKFITDNPREALWEANRSPGTRTPINICGDVNFYLENNRWKMQRNPEP